MMKTDGAGDLIHVIKNAVKNGTFFTTSTMRLYWGATPGYWYYIVCVSSHSENPGWVYSASPHVRTEDLLPDSKFRDLEKKWIVLRNLVKADEEGLLTFDLVRNLLGMSGSALDAKWTMDMGNVRKFLNLEQQPSDSIGVQHLEPQPSDSIGLQHLEQQPSDSIGVQQPTESKTQPEGGKFCSECGAKLYGKFCSECGTKA